MRAGTNSIHLAAALLLVLAWGDPAAAAPDQPDVSGWQCQFCPWPFGWRGKLEFGPGWASDVDPKFADYRGLDREGGFASVGGQLHYLDERGRYFDAYAHELGLESRRLRMRGGRQGAFELRLAYNELPKYRGFGTRTPFRGTGGEVLSLPAGWQPGETTAGMPDLAASLVPADLKTLRKTLAAGASLRRGSKWRWQFDVEHSSKEGTRPFGAGLFTITSSHFPAPVDFTTDRVDLGVEYAGEQAGFSAGLEGSWFDNGNVSLTWTHPFTTFGGADLMRAALEPDNSFYQLRLGGWFASSARFRISGRVAAGRAEQDEPFIPYTINDELETGPLPRASLGGRIDARTLDLMGTASLRVTRRLDLSLRYQALDRDNRTPVALWTPVVTDLVVRPPTPNRPYSFERRDLRLEARYRPGSGNRLRAGVEWQSVDRTLQAIGTSDETTLYAEYGFQRWEAASLRLRFEAASRDVSTYQWPQDPGLVENPLMRKFNLADRERQRVSVEFDWSPVERLDATVAWYRSDDDYESSPIGLQSSGQDSLNLDLAYTVSAAVQAHAWISRDRIDASIMGATDYVTPWRADTLDDFLTFGMGVSARLEHGLEFGLDYLAAEADGDVRTQTSAGEPSFPTLVTRLYYLRAYVQRQVGPRWGWRLLAEHEHYTSRDWQIDGLGVDGIAAILTMGEVSPDYSVTAVRVLATYRF